MQSGCPEWAAYIGAEIRRRMIETECEPTVIAYLLKQIDESELARRLANECSIGKTFEH